MSPHQMHSPRVLPVVPMLPLPREYRTRDDTKNQREKPAGWIQRTCVGENCSKGKRADDISASRDGGRRQPILVLYVLVARTREEQNEVFRVRVQMPAGVGISELHKGRICALDVTNAREGVCSEQDVEVLVLRRPPPSSKWSR